MHSQPHQWKGKTGGGKIGQKSLFFMLKRIDVSVFYPLLYIIVPFYMLFARKRYLAIIRYFKQCYQLPALKSFWETFMNHIVFGQIVLDKFAILAGNRKHLKTEIKGKQYFYQSAERDTGIIVVSCHAGNFEAGGFILNEHKKRVNSLIYGGETEVLKNKRKKILESVNINPISAEDDMSHLFLIKQALENGEILTVLCDRTFGNSKTVKHNFLGREAAFPLAPFMLAVQINVPIFALFVMKKNFRKYQAYIIPIETDNNPNDDNTIKKARQLCISFIGHCEDIVRKYPRQWFNFYDFWAE